MNHLWFVVCLFAASWLYSNITLAQPVSGVMLKQMNSASRDLNYELAYINISKQKVESLRYRHMVSEKQSLGQLMNMDGPRREVVQHGNIISYFEPGIEPFTLSGDHIVDALPSIVYANIDYLEKYYDFIHVGRTRITDRPCEVLRVVSHDGSRYSYVVWIDVDSKLPLRIDLLDREGETLEQYRVISFIVGSQIKNLMADMLNANLPPLMPLPVTANTQFGWSTGWLPAGMYEVAHHRRQLQNMAFPVESRFYSDGLFSFSVNISPAASKESALFYRQGRRSIQTEIRHGNEITLIGELPQSTAKRIADSIIFKAPLQ